MTRAAISEAELVEIGKRADRLYRQSLDEDGNPVDYFGIAVAQDIERLLELARSLR